MPIPRRIHRLGHALEQAVDALGHRLKERSGGFGPLEALAFRGHGNRAELLLRGRVMEDRGLPAARPDDSPLENLLASYRRFETDEVPGARVIVRARGVEERTVTDEEGYFHVRIAGGSAAAGETGWETGEVIVPVQPERGIMETRSAALFRVPAPSARLGVISDVDDTIVQTGATSLVALARNLLLRNALTRLPFPGVAALYRALDAGMGGAEQNPIFYVSSGPWNLYDLLVEYLDVQELPAGPFFLQDIGLDARTLGMGSHLGHKLGRIEEILSVHGHLPFVLLGDSGQKDPEVYREVVRRHPGRILAVYIRDVSVDTRDRIVVEMSDRLRADGVDMVLVRDSLEAAEHAADRGLIGRDRLDAVAAEVRGAG
jgi:phosphatidate phosphatase APP1